MTTPMSPEQALGVKEESDINEKLSRFMGGGYGTRRAYTRDANAVRLAEEKLDEEQLAAYLLALLNLFEQTDVEELSATAAFLAGMWHLQKLPILVRAAALAEVVGE